MTTISFLSRTENEVCLHPGYRKTSCPLPFWRVGFIEGRVREGIRSVHQNVFAVCDRALWIAPCLGGG